MSGAGLFLVAPPARVVYTLYTLTTTNTALRQLVLTRLCDLRLQGLSTRAIATQLNLENLRWQRWGKWHATTIHRQLAGLGLDPSQPGVVVINGSHEVGATITAPWGGREIAGQVIHCEGNRSWIRVQTEVAK